MDPRQLADSFRDMNRRFVALLDALSALMDNQDFARCSSFLRHEALLRYEAGLNWDAPALAGGNHRRTQY
jgi:hypothetical protein